MEGIVFLNRERFVVREIDLATNTEDVAFHWKPGDKRLDFYLPNEVEVGWVNNFGKYNVFFTHNNHVLFKKIENASPSLVAGLMNDYLQFTTEQLHEKAILVQGRKSDDSIEDININEEPRKLHLTLEHAVSSKWNKKFNEIIKVFFIHTFTFQGMNYVNCKHRRSGLYPKIGYFAALIFIGTIFYYTNYVHHYYEAPSAGVELFLVAFIYGGLAFAYLIGLIDCLLELVHRDYVPNPIRFFIRNQS